MVHLPRLLDQPGGKAFPALMPSPPSAYAQVISRTFASFHVPKSRISAAQRNFCGGFDSRQVH